MKKLFKNWCFLLITLCSLIFANTIHASHIMGADLTYREIDTNTGKYRFTLSLYRDCSGITFGGEQLTIVTSTVNTTVSMNAPIVQEVTPICLPPDVATKPVTNCPNGAIGLYKGVERWIFTREYVLGKNNGWAFVGWGSCCRNNIIANTKGKITIKNIILNQFLKTKNGFLKLLF